MLTLDRHLFEWINQTATHPFLDHVLPFLRNGENWIPLYVILLAFAFYKMRKYSFYWIIAVLITVGLADGIGNYGFKKNFERARPCHEASEVEARLLVNCGSGYSFTSNHAANHMALAVFIAVTLFGANTWALLLFLFWALTIGYAQIYVGVHYPADILGGYLLGIICAMLGIRFHGWLKSRDPFFKRTEPSSYA